ncbi:hypothetical protein SAMN02745704_00118 [Paucidesulfovibrio gracilis DSM 16080]|uniref:Uncharacterized protein n=1 Tax=Paucidesulfovibrio gracilis DSM 16080 TaxID=1121449 RepID=A0A1T4W248_9BACT|nr:hypothetical protein [Paucidesulfovibrio gracilis]SKA71322.1 hypothetical protein SAMN02745704_00118 [Paucidesulfovibrio gracilis DSM 16080]
MDLDLMLGLREHIRVTDHVPGKLTLRFGLGVIANPRVIRYVKENGFAPPKGCDMPGIGKTTFHALTRSMVLQYDRDVIMPELLHRLFTCENAVEFKSTAQELAATVHFDLTTFLN